jgi:hypothetical protein
MRPETYTYFVNDMAVSYLRDKINELDIPNGIDFSDSDIRGVVDEVLPAGWYEARVNDVVGQVFSYLRGDRDTIAISVYLGDLKSAAIDALAELADQKLEDYYNSLPQGTPEQTADFLANPPTDSLPGYRPVGYTYGEVKLLAGIDLESTVSVVINDLPDVYTFSDADIREALEGDPGDDDLLTQARDFVRDGFTFTDADLYEELGEQQENIDDVRDWVAADYLFTEQDLHELMVNDEGGGMAEDEWQNMQDARDILGTARTWLWAAWIVPALLLAGVGFLGGRHWYSRIIWAASALAVAALIVYIAFGPVFSALDRPEIDKAIAEAVAGNQGVGAIAADKAASIAGDTVDSVIGGTATLAVVLLAVSLAVIAAAIFLHFRRRRSEEVDLEIPPDNMPLPAPPPPDTPLPLD